MKARVYRNLHKKCFSIQSQKTKRVVAHKAYVTVRDVVFKVSAAGRERVRREKRKNVHAFVCGEVMHSTYALPDGQPREAYYNPYKVESFVDKETNQQVSRASIAFLTPRSIFYWE